MFYHNYVAMDITDSDIRVLSLRKNKVRKWSVTPLQPGLVKGGIIREPLALSVVLNNLFNSLKLKRNRVICTVTGLPFIYRTVSMPGTERIPGEAIERESKREMSVTQEDMYLSWQATESHQNSKEIDYFVMGVPRTSLNPLIETLSKARIKPYIIDIKPLALARTAGLGDALIVSLEHDYFDVVVIAQRLVRIIHSINPSSKSGDTIGLVNDIVDGLNKAIKSFARDFPKNTLPMETPVLLAGEFSSDNSLPQLIQQATGHPVTVITPWLNTPTGMLVGLYAGALGLVAKKISRNHHASVYHDINLNLLTGLKKQSALDAYKAYLVSALICLVLVVMVYVTYDLKTGVTVKVTAFQQEATLLTQRVQAAQKASQQTLANRQAATDKYQNSIKQLTVIRAGNAQIDSQRIDFASRIVFIVDSLPEGVDFKTMDMQLNTVSLTGTAQNAFDIPELASLLEKSIYFSDARIQQISPAQNSGFSFQLAMANRKAD